MVRLRDLGEVLAHVHGAEIEIGEGATPPRREGAIAIDDPKQNPPA
jgi:hypothetical protein